MPIEPPRLSRRRLDVLRRLVRSAADRMSDDQILDLADTLHDALRERRRSRDRAQNPASSAQIYRLPN
ncbi:MAG TPA: hypothetical protein VF633_10530 [Brevundimonas sp.]